MKQQDNDEDNGDDGNDVCVSGLRYAQDVASVCQLPVIDLPTSALLFFNPAATALYVHRYWVLPVVKYQQYCTESDTAKP
jgi:hypothetical protein